MRKIDKEQVIKSLTRANPWWVGNSATRFSELPRRAHFSRLLRLVKQKEPNRALVILGPRRIGKTVLVYQIIDQLIKENISPKKVFYLSLDNPVFRLSTLDELLEWAAEQAETSLESTTIFLDEIQYLNNWEQQVKVLVDTYPNTKFVVTGSAAAAIHRKSKESGAGRFLDYKLPPLSFYEFLYIKGKLEALPPLSIDIIKLNSLYLDYLNFGGFPEAIASKEIQTQPEQYIGQDILDKVLGRDLPSMFGVTDPNELYKLFAALAYNTSNEISLESISQQAGVSKNEIYKYLDFLESAFLIKLIDKTDNKLKKFQRRTHFKVVLTNPSLRSAIFGKISKEDKDLEGLAETAVYSQLIIYEKGYSSYQYARWNHGKDKGEVDLIHMSPKGEANFALEIKWSDSFANNESRAKSLISFCRNNNLNTAVMSSKNIFSTTTHNDCTIQHIPTSLLCLCLGMIGDIKERTSALPPSPSPKDFNQFLEQDFIQNLAGLAHLKAELINWIGKTLPIIRPLSSEK